MGISHFAILIPGNFAGDDPLSGPETTLQLFELAEDIWAKQCLLDLFDDGCQEGADRRCAAYGRAYLSMDYVFESWLMVARHSVCESNAGLLSALTSKAI